MSALTRNRRDRGRETLSPHPATVALRSTHPRAWAAYAFDLLKRAQTWAPLWREGNLSNSSGP